MLVNIIDAHHNNQTISIAAMSFITNQILDILTEFQIPYEVNPTVTYRDPINAQLFVIHPTMRKRLWIANALTLEMQGFAKLVEEVPSIEPARVTETSPFEE